MRHSLAFLLSLLAVPAMALEVLDDTALAEQSGQDGVTVQVSLPNSTLSFSQVGIVNIGGIGGDSHLSQSYTDTAALVFAPSTWGANEGIRLFTDPVVNNTPTSSPVQLSLDTFSTPESKAVLNLGVALPTDLRRIRISPASFYLAPAAGSIFTSRVFNGSAGAISPNVREVLRIGGNGLDFVFAANNPVKANVQLGHEEQGHMLVFTGGALLRISNDFGNNPLQVMSHNTSGTSSLKFDFSLCALDAASAGQGCLPDSSTTGFSLAGFYADIEADALVFGQDGQSDAFNLVLANAVAGTSGNQETNSFNNLKNGSMGSVGLVGVKVSDLQVRVRGL